MRIKDIIEKLGYTPQEASVYLASLELGGSSATEIAVKAKLPRTTTNLVINMLNKKGLMNAYVQRKRRIWAAENPERLLGALQEREAELKAALPELQSLRRDAGAPPVVRAYAGAEEVRQIMNDMIDSKQHISAILPWDEWLAFLGRQFMDDFIEARYRHYLRIRLLTPRSKDSLALKARDGNELRTTQFLPFSSAIRSCTFIYANKVAVISLNKKRPMGIVAEDEDIHHAMEIMFESLWRESGGAA